MSNAPNMKDPRTGMPDGNGPARRGLLFVYRHKGFFKSMDTSKDQAELEKLCVGGTMPWVAAPRAALAHQ